MLSARAPPLSAGPARGPPPDPLDAGRSAVKVRSALHLDGRPACPPRPRRRSPGPAPSPEFLVVATGAELDPGGFHQLRPGGNNMPPGGP